MTPDEPVEQAAVFLLDHSFRFVSANQAALELTGHTPERLMKMSIRDTYHPDDLALGEKLLGKVSVGEALNIRRRLRRADQSYVWVKVFWQKLEDGSYRATMRLAPPEKKQR
jgi:PAS domain S-box-containing protein